MTDFESDPRHGHMKMEKQELLEQINCLLSDLRSYEEHEVVEKMRNILVPLLDAERSRQKEPKCPHSNPIKNCSTCDLIRRVNEEVPCTKQSRSRLRKGH